MPLKNQIRHKINRTNFNQPEEMSKFDIPFDTEAFHIMIQQIMKAA